MKSKLTVKKVSSVKNFRAKSAKATKPVLTTEQKIVHLVRELDMELDGVRMPATAAAIMNGLRRLLGELDDE